MPFVPSHRAKDVFSESEVKLGLDAFPHMQGMESGGEWSSSQSGVSPNQVGLTQILEVALRGPVGCHRPEGGGVAKGLGA